MQPTEADVLILGGGVAGLAAAAVLADRAVVVERDARPGGLVRTECFNGYWFDRVLHLLHFQEAAMRARVQALLGDVLVPCPPSAWIETEAGTARFPIQRNLAGLDVNARIRCLAGLTRAMLAPRLPEAEQSYDAFLLSTFGRGLCDLFYFPYNRKLWKRELSDLVPAGQTWNLQPVSLAAALRGAFVHGGSRGGYNADAFYPRPPASSAVRGMEVLTRALAARVQHLQVNTVVEGIDPGRRTVTVRRDGERMLYRYRACLCTLPLPAAMRMCEGVPSSLRDAAASLPHNAVISIAFSIRGRRPEGCGHWRYYTDESLCFTRLAFMTEFDPLMAPADGWGVLAEIPVRTDTPRPSKTDLVAIAQRDLERADALPPDCAVVDARLMTADPAYVVFTRGAVETAAACRAWLARNEIAALGRYGRWEYSSMTQVMAQAIRWAERAGAELPWENELAECS